MGIRTKFVVSTVALGFFLGYAPVTMSIAEQRRLIQSEFETRGALLAQRLAAVLGERSIQLGTINDATAVNAIKLERDVVEGYILDTKGNIITDGTDRGFRGREPLGSFENLLRNPKGTPTLVRRDGSVLNVTTPIHDGKECAGLVHLILSLDRADGLLAQAINNQLMVFGGLLVGGIALAYVLGHTMTRPLTSMLDGTVAIKNGNFKVRIPVRTRDELGRLTESINEMAASLRSTTVSKKYLDHVLQSMVDSLIVVDTDATIVTVNRATLDLLEYEEKELVGKPASLVCIDEGYQLSGTRLHHLLGEEVQHDHELLYRASSGRTIPISFSGSPIKDNSGDVVGYVCIGKDISERKRAETERERLNRQLVSISRQAGMAEVATGVLHNVGNVLNSVNISASIVAETVRRSKLAGLAKAVELLKGSGEADAKATGGEKTAQVTDYLGRLLTHLTEEQTSVVRELDQLTHHVTHIKEIIAMQQGYAKVTGVIEEVPMNEIVEEAVKINEISLRRHGVELARHFAEVPAVKTDKHKVLQVLVNLISNAKDAMSQTPAGMKRLVIRLRLNDACDMICVDVEDHGEGIAPENMGRLFKHGFTTKKQGHGFGLHSAANTAKELRGSLEARSDGPGRGATFTLSLPVVFAEASA